MYQLAQVTIFSSLLLLLGSCKLNSERAESDPEKIGEKGPRKSMATIDWNFYGPKLKLNEVYSIHAPEGYLEELPNVRELKLNWLDQNEVTSPKHIVISDDPETIDDSMIPQSALQNQDQRDPAQFIIDSLVVPAGRARLIVDHVFAFAPSSYKKYLISFENPSKTSMVTIQFKRAGMDSTPVELYKRYLANSDVRNQPGFFPLKPILLKPGQRKYFSIFEPFYSPNKNIMAIADFSVEGGEVIFESAFVPEYINAFIRESAPKTTAPEAARLPFVSYKKMKHIRGVFKQGDLYNEPAEYDICSGIRRITMDPKGTDWPKGSDATVGRDPNYIPINRGNFGVQRKISLTLKRSKGEDKGCKYNNFFIVVAPGGGASFVPTLEQKQVPIILRRRLQKNPDGTSEHVASILPLERRQLNAGDSFGFKYEFMTVPMASTPLHLVILPFKQ